MSISYTTHLIVGLHGSDWSNTPLKTEGFDDLYDLLVEFFGLECFNPYFDCSYSDSYYGFSVASEGIIAPTSLKDQIFEASQKFLEITGKLPEVRLTLDVN